MTAVANREDAVTVNVDPADYRRILGHLPTGVTVLTCFSAGLPVAMVCNSFTSVSLSPPLVLLCAGKSSATWPLIRAAGRFTVNVMAERSAPIIRQFAAKDVDRFAGVAWTAEHHGPALEHAVAWIDCTVESTHEAGDHDIVVCAVKQLSTAEDGCQPLVFHRGGFGGFRPAAVEADLPAKAPAKASHTPVCGAADLAPGPGMP